MRIALVHVADKGGGAERSVLTLHQSLLELGHESRLYVASKQLDEVGVSQIPRRRAFPGLLRLKQYLEEGCGIQNLYAPTFRHLEEIIGEVDVLHLHSLWKGREQFADLTGIVRLSERYPTVMTLRDGWMMTGHCACPIGCDRWKTGCGACPDLIRTPAVPQDWTATNWRRKRRAIQKSNLHVTAVSNWLKSQVAISPIFAGKKIHVVHNSVDQHDFAPGDQISARRKLGVSTDGFVVLLAGQSIEGFNQGVSQHAVYALNALGDKSVHAMLVGRSASLVAATLNTPSIEIPFQDKPNQMAECYQAADITIVPSEYETFGRVAAESMFCGTPVVSFATGGLTDIVVDGVNGRLVKSGDIGGLMQAIAELKQKPELLAKFRSNCTSARKKFDTQRIASQYLRVYSQAMGDRGHFASFATNVSRANSRVKISCIIPAFNCDKWLKRAVDSVFATRYPNLEVVIVDDGSTDETLKVASQLKAERPDEVVVLQHDKASNMGVSASRNLGMLSSTGDWLCFLDADDYVYPHRFDSAVSILESSSLIDGVHQIAEIKFADTASQEQWFRNQYTFGFDKPIAPDELLGALLKGRCWATSAILFRRTLLQKTGLFKEAFRMAEDCHQWFRMAAVGRIVYGDLSRPVSVYWRRTDSAYQPSANANVQMICAMSDFIKWLSSAEVHEDTRRRARQNVYDYVLNALSEARLSKQRNEAWEIAVKATTQLPSLICDSRYCGQLFRLALGR